MKKFLIIIKGLCILLAISLYLGISLAYTNETGGYVLTGLDGGNYTVYADSPYGTNLVGNSTDVIVRLGETSNADIMLHEGGVITGKVTYVNGTGIANSSIKALGSDWKDAYTDETGRYILTGLGGGNYTVYADSPYGTNLAGNSTDVIVRLGETSNADIVLHEGGVITGKVTYVNGTGIANSSIKASGPNWEYGPDWIYAYKDGTGGYILTGLKDGNYTVYADSPFGTNLVGNNTDVIVRLGETSNADIVLHEGGVITGKVTYVNGTGIANSSIKASGSDWRYGPKDAYTDETGRYILTGLDGGNYTVYADSPYGTNLVGNVTGVIVRLGETSNADMVLHEGGIITGKVTYVNGTGIANSSIKASGSDWRHGPKETYTDKTGGYILTGLGGGNYIVLADSPYRTNLAGNSTDIIVRLGETSNADIVLHEGGVITGKVTYVNGTGIANSSIKASGSDWKDAYTDETGRYILTGLGGGNYIVLADSPYGTNLVRNRTDVIVRPGETSNANMVLHEGGVITGKVTYVNGTGIANSSVEIIGDRGGGGGGDFPIFPFVDDTPSQKNIILINYLPPEKKENNFIVTLYAIIVTLSPIISIIFIIFMLLYGGGNPGRRNTIKEKINLFLNKLKKNF